MSSKQSHNDENKILTIPNILSFFRICLIPVIIWLFCVKHEYRWTGIVLIISGITDLADGFIARHFNRITNLGKILDPIADKLTQGAMLFCLITRFRFMLIPLLLLVVKEIFVGYTNLLVIRKTKQVLGAEWHGKASTCLLYAMMILHAFWHDIPLLVSNLSIAICTIMMATSLVIYGTRNIKTLRED